MAWLVKNRWRVGEFEASMMTEISKKTLYGLKYPKDSDFVSPTASPISSGIIPTMNMPGSYKEYRHIKATMDKHQFFLFSKMIEFKNK